MQPVDVNIRTTVSANSISRFFGPPGAVDYRSHPGQREADDPRTVFRSMKTKEITPLSDIKFLKGSIYSYKNRKVITRWLRDVCGAFALKATTLALAVQLTDAYIIRNLDTLAVNRCQLAAITSLWIAAKFEEMDDSLPDLKSIVEVCDKAYTADEVLAMEEDVLNHFQWKLPHTTLVNHLYLYLHMHSTFPVTPPPGPKPQAAQDVVSVGIVTVDAATKQNSVINTTISSRSPLQQSLPLLCNAIQMPVTASVEIFELMGSDFLLAKRLLLTRSPLELGCGDHVMLYLANRSNSSAVFAERDQVVLLRSVNSLMLHLCLDVLAPEVLTHVEFLRLPSHVVGLGVLALSRCIVGVSMEEVKVAVTTTLKLFEISGAQALAAADLLCEKYQEALQSSNLPPPLPRCPADIQERLRFVFSK